MFSFLSDSKMSKYQKAIRSHKTIFFIFHKELEEERKGRIELDIRCQKLQVNVDDLRDQLKRKDYKNENFDTLRR